MPNSEPETVAGLRRRADRARSLARDLLPEDRERILQFADELDTRAKELARDGEPPLRE